MNLRGLAGFVAGMVFLGLCTACSGNEASAANDLMDDISGSLVLCVDDMASDISAIVHRMEGRYSEVELVVEYIPGDESAVEREAFLTSLRAEILAGKGPDVLYLSASSNYVSALFADENKAMATGILEDISQWVPQQTLSELNQVVLGAGQLEGKQYILPVDYYVEGLLFSDKSWPEAAPLFESIKTARDIAEVLPRLYDMYDTPWRVTFDITKEIQSSMIEYGTMDISIEYEALETLIAVNKNSFDIELDQLPPQGPYQSGGEGSPLIPFAQQYVNLGFSAHMVKLVADAFGQADAKLVPIALPNSAGGYTARPGSYVVIPANSRNKPAAAAFIDLLLDPVYQSTSASVNGAVPWMHGMPVRMGCIGSYYKEQGCGNEAIQAMQEIEQSITDACFLPKEFREIIEEQENRFYNGEIDAGEALEAIESRLQVYMYS